MKNLRESKLISGDNLTVADSTRKVIWIGAMALALVIGLYLIYLGGDEIDYMYKKLVTPDRLGKQVEDRPRVKKLRRMVLRLYSNEEVVYEDIAFDLHGLLEEFVPFGDTKKVKLYFLEKIQPYFEDKGEYFNLFLEYAGEDELKASFILAEIIEQKRKRREFEGKEISYTSYIIGDRIIPTLEEYKSGEVPSTLVFYEENNPDSSQAIHFNSEHRKYSNKVYRAFQNDNRELIKTRLIGKGDIYEETRQKYNHFTSNFNETVAERKFRDYVEKGYMEDNEKLKFGSSIEPNDE